MTIKPEVRTTYTVEFDNDEARLIAKIIGKTSHEHRVGVLGLSIDESKSLANIFNNMRSTFYD